MAVKPQPLVGQAFLEGRLDRYRDFLKQTTNAELLDASEDFCFEITSVETPNLVVREVNTRGQASNQYEQGDAFFGLMLSHGPGAFSTGAPLPPVPLSLCSRSSPPALHWHLPNIRAVSNHRDARVTYLRIEAAGLLRHLALAGLSVAELANLQDRELPEALVQLITQLGPRLEGALAADQPALVEAFLADLCDQFQAMGAAAAAKSASAFHVRDAIGLLVADPSSPPELADLSCALGLTPRAVQANFRSRLGIAPMRWLKLHQLSQLRRLLCSSQHGDLALKQQESACGLMATRSARESYREVYGLTPAEDQHRVQRWLTSRSSPPSSQQTTMQFLFPSTELAIAALRQIENQRPPGQDQTVMISINAAISWLSRPPFQKP
jgi:AraC-like DNA-binding protein